jgi:sugar (pentulose or hexulose) kinase
MSDLVLGVDCSTTASKVIAWDRNGKALAEGRASLREIRPRPRPTSTATRPRRARSAWAPGDRCWCRTSMA